MIALIYTSWKSDGLRSPEKEFTLSIYHRKICGKQMLLFTCEQRVYPYAFDIKVQDKGINTYSEEE